MTTQIIPIEQLDKGGVNFDSPSITLPPNMFSDAKNVRFNDGAIRRFLGHLEILDTDYSQIDTDGSKLLAVDYWESPVGSFYVFAYNVNPDTDRVALVTVDNQGEPEIIKFTSNDFTYNGKWQFTTFNGGYTLIVNNGIDTPHHITTTQGAEFSSLMLEPLPNWAGYNNGDSDVNSVSAGIIISAGNTLVAGDLVERDSDGNIARELRGVVRSSDVAAPGNIPQNWNPFQTGTNTADELLLADTGFISALISLQGKVFAFTQDSIHQVDITSQGLRTIPITYQYGALNQGAVFEFDGRMIVVGTNDIYEFSGHPASIQSIADGRVRRYFFDKLNPVHTDVFMERNLKFDEMWIGFANTASTTGSANEALVFNYRDNTWTTRDLPNVVSMTSGAIPGGGITGTSISISGTGRTGEFGVCDAGTREERRLRVTGTSLAAHNGVQQQQTLTFSSPESELQYEQREIFDLKIENNGSADAHPNLIHAVNRITFPTITPLYNSSVAGGTRLTLNGVNPETVTIEASELDSFTNLATYITALRNAINTDVIAGLEDYTATDTDNGLVLTSDVMGPRTFSNGTITTYTGNPNTTITQATVGHGLSFSRQSAAALPAFSGSGSTPTNNVNGGGVNVNVEEDGMTDMSFSGSRGINGDGSATLFTAPGNGTVTINRNHNQGGYSISRNGTVVANGSGSGSHSFSMSAGDVFSGGGADGVPGSNDPQAWSFSWSGTYNVTAYDITFINTNDYPVTLLSSSTGGARTLAENSSVLVQDSGASNNWSIASNSVPRWSWSVTNNRPEGLQEDVFNVTAVVGSDTLVFGDVERGDTAQATELTTQTNTTVTSFEANIFSLSTLSTGTVTTANTDNVQTFGAGNIFVNRTTSTTTLNSQTVSLSGTGTTRTIATTIGQYYDFTLRMNNNGYVTGTNAGGGTCSISVSYPRTSFILTGADGMTGQRSHQSTVNGTATVVIEGTTYTDDQAAATQTHDIDSSWEASFGTNGGGGIAGEPDTGCSAYNNSVQARYQLRISGIATSSQLTFSDLLGELVLINDNHNTSMSTTTYSYEAYSESNLETTTLSTGGTTYTLSTTPQIISPTTQTFSFVGSYEIASGQQVETGSTSHNTNTIGNGLYGVADEDAPSIRLRLTHSGLDNFVVSIEPFPEDTDTTLEYRDYLLDQLGAYPAFQGYNPYTFPKDSQPDDAVFYVTISRDDSDSIRFINVDTENHDPISVEVFTEVEDTEYSHTLFGGDITTDTVPITDGGGGEVAPVVTYTHPDLGATTVVYFGTYTTAEDLATHTHNAFSDISGFTSSVSGAVVTLTKDAVDTDTEVVVQTLNGADDFQATIVQSRAGVIASNMEPILQINSPDFGFYTVDLDGVGTPETTVSSAEIAKAIVDQFAGENEDIQQNWTAEIDPNDPDSETVLYKSSYDVRYEVPNGPWLDSEMLVANTTPGYTGQRLGRDADSDQWNYIVTSYGTTGTTPAMLSSDSDSESVAGVNPTFSTSGYVYIQYGDLDTTLVQLDSETIDSVGQKIYNAFRAKDFYEASYNSTTDIVELIATDYSSAARAQILMVDIDNGTYSADCSDSTVLLNHNTTRENDEERPWTTTSFNTSRPFIVMAADSDIYAADLTTTFAGESFEAYVERKRLHLAPTKDVESLHAMYIDRVGGGDTDGDSDLIIAIKTTDNPHKDVVLTTLDTDENYSQKLDAYKTDVRKTGRLVNYRIGNKSGKDFTIENISLEIGKGGTR